MYNDSILTEDLYGRDLAPEPELSPQERYEEDLMSSNHILNSNEAEMFARNAQYMALDNPLLDPTLNVDMRADRDNILDRNFHDDATMRTIGAHKSANSDAGREVVADVRAGMDVGTAAVTIEKAAEVVKLEQSVAREERERELSATKKAIDAERRTIEDREIEDKKDPKKEADAEILKDELNEELKEIDEKKDKKDKDALDTEELIALNPSQQLNEIPVDRSGKALRERVSQKRAENALGLNEANIEILSRHSRRPVSSLNTKLEENIDVLMEGARDINLGKTPNRDEDLELNPGKNLAAEEIKLEPNKIESPAEELREVNLDEDLDMEVINVDSRSFLNGETLDAELYSNEVAEWANYYDEVARATY